MQAAARFFRFGPDEIGVVHDDTELAFGKAAIRLGGGLAGHNGLRSVSSSLSSRGFWRVRIGVGRPERGDLRSHVLGRFSPEEEASLAKILQRVATLVVTACREGWASAAS